MAAEAYDGRIILIFSKDGKSEPRFQVQRGFDSAQIFGVDLEGFKQGQSVEIAAGVVGYPLGDLAEIPAGDYTVQVVLHKYETFNLANGKTVKLPAARGAGQNWRKEPGNVISTPVRVSFDPKRSGEIALTLNTVLPPIPDPIDTEFVKYFKFRSPSLSTFWGRDVFINGHVLLPKGFDTHPEARFPLAIMHGHFPEAFGGFQTEPPPADLKCVPNARFNEPCYNRIEQEEAYRFYKQWVSDDFPEC